MKSARPNPLRITRRLQQFRLSLIAALASLALAGCDATVSSANAQSATNPAASSIAKGVQHILQNSQTHSPASGGGLYATRN